MNSFLLLGHTSAPQAVECAIFVPAVDEIQKGVAIVMGAADQAPQIQAFNQVCQYCLFSMDLYITTTTRVLKN